MGNAGCGANKAQLLCDAARDISDSADEWMGKGILTAERNVQEGQLRLGVNPSDPLGPGSRLCKQVARRPREDEFSSEVLTRAASSSRSTSSGSSKGFALEAASRSLAYDLSDNDVECRRFEAIISDAAEVLATEKDIARVAPIMCNYVGMDHFMVTLRVEVASASFKRASSPFGDASWVEESVRKALEPHNVDVVRFATNFGNCVVEKAFCGGVLTLSCTKARAGSDEGSFELQLGAGRFIVQLAQRGGDAVLATRGAVPLDQVDKQIRQWSRSFALEHLIGRSRVAQVVRLKLAPFSRVAGLNVPGALASMDLDRTEQCEKAREGLKRVERLRSLAELRAAVDAALAAGLEDDLLPALQEKRRRLDGALSALHQAARLESVEALQTALARSAETELPDWEPGEHDKAAALLEALHERKQRKRLQAAVAAAEIRLDDIVRILTEAFEAEGADLPEFGELQSRLAACIDDLTHRVNEDALSDEQAQAHLATLDGLPDAAPLAPVRAAAERLQEALEEMRERAEEARRRAEEAAEEARRRAEERRSFVVRTRSVRTRVAGALLEHANGAAPEELSRALLEADAVLQEAGPDMRGPVDGEDDDEHQALEDIRQRAWAVLEEQRQLHAHLRSQLEALFARAGDPGAAVAGIGEEAVAAVRRLLKRMETCEPKTCQQDCEDAKALIAQVQEYIDCERARRMREDAHERLRQCMNCGDPHILDEALNHAKACGVSEADLLKAEARLQTLLAVERQLQSAMEKGDRVHLSKALDEAARQQLKTPTVDEAHRAYKQAEEVFARACTPAGMVWAMEEQRRMWVTLCLRRPLAGSGDAPADGGKDPRRMLHPFTVAVSELCHNAQISPEAEPYPVQFIHHALRRLLRPPGAKSAPGRPSPEVQEALEKALADFFGGPVDGPPSADELGVAGSEAGIDAQQFNRVGVVANQAGLESTAHLLWWLVCIVEWETGHRLLGAFIGEMARRTADLLSEAESTSRSFRTHMVALQARGLASPEDEGGLALGVPPEVAPETRHGVAASAALAVAGAGTNAAASADARIGAVRGVLDEVDQVKRETERLQGTIEKQKIDSGALGPGGGGVPSICRILELLQQAHPRSPEEARAAVQLRQREASGRTREIIADTYARLEARLLQLHYKGRQALDGEPVTDPPGPVSRTLGTPGNPAAPLAAAMPLVTLSPSVEVASSSSQDFAFLHLLGVPEGARGVACSVDRTFLRVEIYERFSEKTGAVEDEFEKLCRGAVAEARQRCGDRRWVAALKPLLVDLVKRRQCISSMLNTLHSCGLDKAEKSFLRKHLQPRDLLIALTFSSMPLGPSQARMMSLAAKTDSALPLLFGWARPANGGGSALQGSATSASGRGAREPSRSGILDEGGGLQICTQIHWGALRELFCSPSHPLVLSIGTKATLGKSYLLQYLYALQECHFRGSTQPPLKIHAMPSIDLIGDFAREEPLRGVTLADVHCYTSADELCEALVATLASCAELMMLHVSLKDDYLSCTGDDSQSDDHAAAQLSPELVELIDLLSACASGSQLVGATVDHPASPTILLLLRDADLEESGSSEQGRAAACLNDIHLRLASAGGASGPRPAVLAWLVPPLTGLGQTELTNEVKSLRKSRALQGGAHTVPLPTLEEALVRAARSSRKFPSMPVLQERYELFAAALRHDGSEFPRKADNVRPPARAWQSRLPRQLPSESYGGLAQRIFRELGAIGASEGLLPKLFPISHCHQQLTALSQQKQRCLNRGREYLEPEERRRLESNAEALDREIAKLRRVRQQAPPHALLKTFGQLVLAGDCDRIAEFGVYLDDWKQLRRAPLLEAKLRLRKELDHLLEESNVAAEKSANASSTGKGAAPSTTTAAGPDSVRVAELRGELTGLQRRLDEVDVSTDSLWLELMLWHEMERIGARSGLREIDERLTFSACKACYLNWIKNGNPVHFLHSAPLQFGAFEPLRWHPQISGASLFGSDFIGDMLRELDRDLGVDVRKRPLLVISVIGVQSSGKSTLMNYLFGCSFATHVGRCTKGLYISLLETKKELIVILDTEGLLSVEARDDVFDKQVALMTMACSDLVIVNNRGELGRHVGDLFQVCLFALYHLKLARISPAIGFVLQCLSMVNQQQQYEWVATVKKSLEESVQELQQKEKPHSFRLQDLVFLDSESIFVMPSAFNDDVQFGLQVSRPTNLYALKALQLREKVFQWIGRAKASQKQRLREADALPNAPEATSGTASFASLSQWYEHARTVWQTLSMCGTDLLQFRTMRQVLMAQQLQEFCDALVQKYIDEKLSTESEALIERHTKVLRTAGATSDVHAVDNAFRGQLDSLRDAALQEMYHDFDEFVKAHSSKFTDEQVKNDKRFSLMGPMRRKYASVDSLWRSAVHLALEQRSMDHLFEEISARVTDLLLEQGTTVNVQNVERVFEEKWSQVMAEALQKQRPNLQRVVEEVIWHFNAALSNLKSQFRKAHVFHGVKSLSVHEMGTDVEVCSSFLLSKKGVGDALVPSNVPGLAGSAKTQVDNVWIKLVDAMRLEVDQQGQMSDAGALKILNRLNSEMEAGDQLRQLMHRIGSAFVHRVFHEIARATMHYRFQIEQQNFQARISEVLGKKQQKLWEIQARVDSGKREVHCAKVWAKTFVDTLDSHFKNAVGRMAQEIVSHMANILTNPANACELAIERSFTKRNWRHVVMYAIDPTQYLFMEFHKEWEQFKQGLVDQYCQELKSNFGTCLRLAEGRMRGLLASGSLEAASDMTMNRLSQEVRDACEELADETLSSVLCSCLPSFTADADWPLNNLEQFVQFASVELQRYRANMRQTELTVERRMEVEIARQKANCWKCICGCTARCPGCGTKCNLESENHWPERPHECRRHLYPAFNGWQKQEGRKPFLLHCRAKAQWQIARTRPPIEPGGPERYWDNFQEMLEDEHPDWLDPVTRAPLPSMEPLSEYEEDCPAAPEDIQREIEENRRAWANCKDALLEHFTSMADDEDLEWLDKYKREGGALRAEDFASIRDELFAVTPLESLDLMENAAQPFEDSPRRLPTGWKSKAGT